MFLTGLALLSTYCLLSTSQDLEEKHARSRNRRDRRSDAIKRKRRLADQACQQHEEITASHWLLRDDDN